MPEQTRITLTIYNLLGQEVVRLIDGMKAAGRYEVMWSGTNGRGAGVASGIYLYRIVSGSGYTDTKRMTLLKASCFSRIHPPAGDPGQEGLSCCREYQIPHRRSSLGENRKSLRAWALKDLTPVFSKVLGSVRGFTPEWHQRGAAGKVQIGLPPKLE